MDAASTSQPPLGNTEPLSFLYLDAQGQSKGPMASAVLLKMLRKGVGVTPNTMVWTNGMPLWASMREVEPFKDEASLDGFTWHYVDAESGEQKGPIPSRLLLHFMEEGKVDGMTQIYDQRQNAWLQLGQVGELRQIMQRMVEEEEARQQNIVLNAGSDTDQVYEADSDIPLIPEEMYQNNTKAAATSTAKRSFKSDDGKSFVWDTAENDWVEDENPSASEEEADEEDDQAEGRGKKQPHAQNKNGDAEGGLPVDADDAQQDDDKAAARKRKKKKKKASSWKENAAGLWVYVTGLPSDVTTDELKAHFSKVGLLAISPVDQQPKIKIYLNPDGSIKGDCSICFNAPESVQMALELLDEGYLRIGCKIGVTKAQFQKREGGTGGEDESGGQPTKRARPNISHAQIKVAQSISKQALAWNEDDDLGVSKKKALKIVVLEGMFTVQDAQDDKFMDELETDIVSECEKCGAIEKITVFSKNPRGIVIVKFGTAFAAQECVRILDGRFFGGQKIKSFFWDGKSDYSVPLTDAQAAAADKEEEERLKEFGDWLDHDQDELPEELRLRVES